MALAEFKTSAIDNKFVLQWQKKCCGMLGLLSSTNQHLSSFKQVWQCVLPFVSWCHSTHCGIFVFLFPQIASVTIFSNKPINSPPFFYLQTFAIILYRIICIFSSDQSPKNRSLLLLKELIHPFRILLRHKRLPCDSLYLCVIWYNALITICII